MTITLAPMQRENMTKCIYREIKQKIMMGELRPGETITLRSITDTLGVSQTPVREALLQLVSERASAQPASRSRCLSSTRGAAAGIAQHPADKFRGAARCRTPRRR